MVYFKIKLLTLAEQIQKKNNYIFSAGEVITLPKFKIWPSPI